MKRCLSLGFSLPIVVLTGFRRNQSAYPALPAGPAPVAKMPPTEPQLEPASTRTFYGTIVRDGVHFALRESDGQLHPLDSAGRAWTYEGEDVLITGRLDAASRILQIQTIEGIEELPTPPHRRRRARESA